jgi:protein TonB
MFDAARSQPAGGPLTSQPAGGPLTRNADVPAVRLGTGLVIAIELHALAVAVAVHCAAPTLPRAIEEPEAKEVLFEATLLPPPPLPPPGVASEPDVAQPKKPAVVQRPREPFHGRAASGPTPRAPAESETPAESLAARPDGTTAGDTVTMGTLDGGVAGAREGGARTAPAAPVEVTLPFGEGMTPPVLVGGSTQPIVPREAREAKVSGKIVARCTITETGMLVECRILRSLPFMDEAVLANLASRRYTPVMFQGHPQRIHFNFYITVK